MWVVPTCMAVAVGCGWCPRVWRGVVGCGWCPRVWRWLVGRGWCPRVWPSQLDVIGTHEFGGGSWMWFVPRVWLLPIGCDWWHRVCGGSSWM